ncbi:acid phosphatase type 7-like isoform X2 [Lineus longissimus]|uniref:acid phosphatase type 7-like isoform X2 n=1 Tax=Lineus longissimus TaxID=88925 RepID=UPI002B4C3CF5
MMGLLSKKNFLQLPMFLAFAFGQVYYQPEQIHLSYGDAPTKMVLTWVTMDNTTTSEVQYGIKTLGSVAKGTIDLFTDGGAAARKFYMHRVIVTGLTPGTAYRYRVGSTNYGWSSLYTFTAMPGQGAAWSPRFAVYGDMGNKNAQSLTRLQTEAENGNFDFILHVGDFAYNMDTNDATVGDAFMRQISSIASYIPYMTCVGNHEAAYNFSNYKSRFTMPPAGGDGQNMWYSFNVGPIHFIAWDTEAYYYNGAGYGTAQIFNQFKWLEQDLMAANTATNRTLQPWIITLGHRPMYCSNNDDAEHCINPENVARIGDPSKGWPGVEDLFYKYGVDLEFGAHEHSYERLWPVYNLRVCNGSLKAPYTNPTGPVHIVTGSAKTPCTARGSD